MIKQLHCSQRLSLVITLVVGTMTMGCANAKLMAVLPSQPTVTLEIQNYCPKTGYNYVNHFAYNSSAYFNSNQWVTDTDRDGLADVFEQTLTNLNFFGTSYLSADTSGNGYSDLVKVRLNLNASQQASMPICQTGTTDTDGDGLSDCEEALMGTDPTLADYDLDGIPDGLEVRFGLNPVDPNDALSQITGDGYTNLQKVKMGVNINTFISSTTKAMMPVYSQTPSSTQPGCSTLYISNLTVMQVQNSNQLQVIALEDSQNPPTTGTHSVDREARNLTVLVPATVPKGATIVVPDGIHGQVVDGINIPLNVVGGSGS